MTKRNRSRRTSFAARLSRVFAFFGGGVPLFAFVALLLNLYVVFKFERSRTPQLVYYVATNAVPSSAVATPALPSAASAPLPEIPSGANAPLVKNPTNTPPRVVRMSTDYVYYTYDGARAVVLFGRPAHEGSFTSWGRIETIYPDCILLEDGSYIVNTRWLSGGPAPLTPKKDNANDGV